jgi:LPS-assembly protein
MKKYLTTLFPAVISLSLAVTAVAGAEEVSPPGAVVINADSLTYQKSDDTYRALGDVHLEWDGMALVADSALLREAENTAEAEGRVVVTKDGDKLHADKLTLNLENQKGEITNGYLFMKKGNFHIRGARMDKTGDEDYHIEKGSLTPCDGQNPSWKISASSVDVTLGEYATARNALFYIRNVPVFYFPYVIFPLRKERQSGFLIPKAGTTTKKGFTINIPYYWAISPSQDATFYLDVLSKRGVGTGVDYRYLRKSGSSGGFYGFQIYDTKTKSLRGEIYQKHQEEISPTLFFRSDVGYVSDRNYLQDYAEAFGEYNKKSIDSYVFLTKHWQRFLLTPELRYTQDLEASSNVTTLQKLPIITFTGIKQNIGQLPLYFSLDSNFINFYRESGLQGQRVEALPTMQVYAKPADWLEGSAWAGYQRRFYNVYDGTTPSGTSAIGIFDAGASLSSTLARVYDTGWKKLVKLKHTIIPEVGYLWVENRDQNSLPFFDYTDRVVNRNAATYGVTNYLAGKFVDGDASPVYRDLAYLRLSQEYDISGTRRDLLTAYDQLRPFSDIWIQAKINMTGKASLLVDSRFNPYQSDFDENNYAVQYDDGKGNRASVGYRFTRTQWEYIEGSLTSSLLKPFYLTAAGRYAINGGVLLDTSYSVEYRHQCWSVILSYSDRQGNTAFYVNFALAGLGPLGRVRLY